MSTKKIDSTGKAQGKVVQTVFSCRKISANRYHVKVQYRDDFEWCGFVDSVRFKEMVHEEATYQDS